MQSLFIMAKEALAKKDLDGYMNEEEEGEAYAEDVYWFFFLNFWKMLVLKFVFEMSVLKFVLEMCV